MNAYKFGDLVRVSKRKARSLWGKVDMSLCPCNLRPGGPWRPDMRVFALDIAKGLTSEYEQEQHYVSFDTYIQNFEWYNCSCSETGLYTSFYIKAL